MAGNKKRFEQAMNRGHSAAWDMELEKAAEYYRQALEEFPDNAQTLSSLATTLMELGDHNEALKYFRKVIEVTPRDPLPLEKIAQILAHQKKHSKGADVAFRAAEIHLQNRDVYKAIENWSLSVDLNPEKIRARTRLATTFERLGQKQQAVTEYLALASLLQHSGKHDKALELVDHALELVPNNSEAKQALDLLRSNQPLPRPVHRRRETGPFGLPKPQASELGEKALPEPKKAKKPSGALISSTRQKALSKLAEVMFEQDEGNNRGPRNLGTITRTGPLSQARGERTKIMLHLTQAVDFQTRGKIEDSIKALENAVEAGLDNAAAYFDLGLLYKEVGRMESALRNLKRAFGHPEFSLASRLLMGQTLREMEKYKESATHYLEALKIADSMAVDPSQSGQLRQIYEHVIETYTQNADEKAHAQLCEAVDGLLTDEHYMERIEEMRQQLPKQPDGLPPRPLAEILTQAESSEAVELLSKIHSLAREGFVRVAMEEAYWGLQHAPQYLPLHTLIGDLLLKQDLVDEAATKFSVVARAYSSRGESNMAIEMFRRVTKLAPLDLSVRESLISQLLASGRQEATIREYLELGDMYYRLADLEKARETYQKGLGIAQQTVVDTKWTIAILHHLADIDMQRLDWQRALRIFQQIRSMKSDDEKAAVGTIDLLFRMGRDKQALTELGNFVKQLNEQKQNEKAEKILDSLLANNPEQINVRHFLANQYAKGGKKQEAIEQLDQIGDMLLNKGDRKGAIQAIEAIVKLGPENEMEYQQLLEELRG